MSTDCQMCSQLEYLLGVVRAHSQLTERGFGHLSAISRQDNSPRDEDAHGNRHFASFLNGPRGLAIALHSDLALLAYIPSSGFSEAFSQRKTPTFSVLEWASERRRVQSIDGAVRR